MSAIHINLMHVTKRIWYNYTAKDGNIAMASNSQSDFGSPNYKVFTMYRWQRATPSAALEEIRNISSSTQQPHTWRY